MPDVRVGVVGATGAVGTVTLELLAERGFDDVRAFASARSAGRAASYGERELLVEEATPDALAADELDLVFFSVGTDASRELVPHAVRGGAVVIDKSDAYRLQEGIPLVVAGVNDDALNGSEIIANPNCSAMQLACVLEPAPGGGGPRARPPGHLPVGLRCRRRRHRAATEPRRGRGQPRHGLGARRRGVLRGMEAPRRDAEDPRAARSTPTRDVRAGSRPRRSRSGRLGRDRVAALAGRGAGGARLLRPGRAGRPTDPGRCRGPGQGARGTRSAGTRQATASRSGSSTTTCARARR